MRTHPVNHAHPLGEELGCVALTKVASTVTGRDVADNLANAHAHPTQLYVVTRVGIAVQPQPREGSAWNRPAAPQPKLSTHSALPHSSCHAEGVAHAHCILLRPLEPAFVTGLHPQHIQLVVADRGADQHVVAAFIAVGGPHQQLVLVKLLAALVGVGLVVNQVGGGNLAGGKAALRLGLLCQSGKGNEGQGSQSG